MYLLESWKDSLSLFKPKNFKLFALVTLKTIGQTYWLLLKYFWWVQLGVIGLYFWFPQSNLRELIQYLVYCIWLAIVALCVRPSVAKKNYAYFSKYLLYLPVIIVGFVAIHDLLELHIQGRYLIMFACFVAQLLFIFFMFDMSFGVKNALKSLVFAIKMFWYNAPGLFLIIGANFVLVILQIRILQGVIQSAIWESLHGHHIQYFFKCMYFFNYFIVIPIIVSIIGNFYIKRLHEQPQLYFKQPKEQE